MHDSGALLLDFLAAGMVDSAIIQNMCHKMHFNLNTVYAYMPYTCTCKLYNRVGHTLSTQARETTNCVSEYQFHEFRPLSTIAEN